MAALGERSVHTADPEGSILKTQIAANINLYLPPHLAISINANAAAAAGFAAEVISLMSALPFLTHKHARLRVRVGLPSDAKHLCRVVSRRGSERGRT